MARERKRIGARLRARVPRRRRAPEEARQEILDAAERVFAGSPPEQVGLKDIAGEAGVSHALITHYFGTYAGLVEAALERRMRRVREEVLVRLREAGALSRPDEMLGILFRTLDDPVHVRLMKWLIGTERPAASYALAFQEQGIRIIAQQVAEAAMAQPTRAVVERIELALVTAVSAAFGYAISKYTLAGAIGRPVGGELDLAVQRTLASMLAAYLRDAVA